MADICVRVVFAYLLERGWIIAGEVEMFNWIGLPVYKPLWAVLWTEYCATQAVTFFMFSL